MGVRYKGVDGVIKLDEKILATASYDIDATGSGVLTNIDGRAEFRKAAREGRHIVLSINTDMSVKLHISKYDFSNQRALVIVTQ